MLRAAVRHHPPLAARRSALALLYLIEDGDAARADFGPGSAPLRQLQLALADDDADVRLSSARAVTHLLTKRLAVDFEQLNDAPGAASEGGAAAGGAGAAGAVMHSFADAFGSEQDSDVCFEVEGRSLHAHRILLRSSLGTDVFGAMLRHDTADSRTGRVPVAGVGYEAFAALIKYLYTGELEAQETALLLEVFRAARRWLVGPLAALCAARLAARLSAERWQGVWELLELQAEGEGGGEAAEALQAAVGRFLLRHVEALVAQPVYVERRAELAALLLEHALPPLLL